MELSAARLTEDKPLCRGVHCLGRKYIFHHPLPQKEARVAAKPPQVSVSPLTRRGGGLSDRPRHPFGSLTYNLVPYPTSARRGGSVSRRDHNQVYRRANVLTGGTTYAEAHKPNASCSSGEGVWGRGASLREAASPPASPYRKISSGGSAREGASLSEKPPPSQNSLLPYYRN